ncbi:MAG: hypothetical protein EP312_09475 [Gammaproteobacteria bacterium]|nr:MAG: hypothetical protein EP312_09475 [Gammaproteobacteria bacterium]
MKVPVCPCCQEKMASTSANEVLVYSCLYCSGHWVPRKSIDRLFSLAGRKLSSSGLLSKAGQHTSGKCCAQCANQAMRALVMEGVEIDVCPACAGIFFDADELRKVVPVTFPVKEGMTTWFLLEGLAGLLSAIFL